MNITEQRMLEDLFKRLSELSDETRALRREYRSLKEEVLDFFKNVKNGQDLEESIEEFEIGLSNYCNIEVVEEIGFKSNTGGE